MSPSGLSASLFQLPALFPDVPEIAEASPRLGPGLGALPPILDQLLRAELEVERELPLDVLGDRTTEEWPPRAGDSEWALWAL